MWVVVRTRRARSILPGLFLWLPRCFSLSLLPLPADIGGGDAKATSISSIDFGAISTLLFRAPLGTFVLPTYNTSTLLVQTNWWLVVLRTDYGTPAIPMDLNGYSTFTAYFRLIVHLHPHSCYFTWYSVLRASSRTDATVLRTGKEYGVMCADEEN